MENILKSNDIEEKNYQNLVKLALGGSGPNQPFLLEYDETKVLLDYKLKTLLSPSGEGLARLVVTNQSGFTHRR